MRHFAPFAWWLSLVAALPAIAQPSTPVPARPAAESGDIAAFTGRLKRTVFRVKAQSASKDVYATGTGFPVGVDGYAFTNFHVVQGATGAEAEFPGTGKSSPIELVLVDPELDLALVRLTNKEFLSSLAPLELAPEPFVEGTTVWAIGYPKGFGFSMSRGVINGVRAYSELPENLRKQLKYAAESRWVQTDATINAGNSGGPLVDDNGMVVGINTWIWLEGQNLYFALSSKHLTPLFQRRSEQPLGFKKAAEMYGTVKTAVLSFPTLEITPKHDVRTAMRPVSDLKRWFCCAHCAGCGSISKQVVTGWRQIPLGREPIYSTRVDPCEACSRTGYGDSSQYAAGISRVVEAVVQAKRDDSYDKHLPLIAKRIREALDRAHGSPPAQSNAFATRVFAGSADRAGKPVWYFGRVVSDLDIPSIGRQRLISLGGEKTTLVASDLQFSDAGDGN